MSDVPTPAPRPSLLVLVMFAATGCGEATPHPEAPDEVVVDAPPVVSVEPIADDLPLVDEPDDARSTRCDAACAEDGLCTKMDGACVAMEDAHCRQSKACRDQGRCTAEEHQCVKADHPACAAFIAAMRACMAKMPPDAQQSLTTMLEALENAVKTDEPAAQQAMTENCQHMITSLAGSPLCQ